MQQRAALCDVSARSVYERLTPPKSNWWMKLKTNWWPFLNWSLALSAIETASGLHNILFKSQWNQNQGHWSRVRTSNLEPRLSKSQSQNGNCRWSQHGNLSQSPVIEFLPPPPTPPSIWEINLTLRRWIQKRALSEEVCTQFAIRGTETPGKTGLGTGAGVRKEN